MFKQKSFMDVAVSLFLVLSFMVSFGFAQDIPQKISYQGKLLEAGEPVDGTKTMVFSIGTWEETQDVEITNGLYSVTLGGVNPIPAEVFASNSAVLQITVEGTELPQTEILSVPYAYKAEKAGDANKLDGEDAATYSNIESINGMQGDADGNISISEGDNISISSEDNTVTISATVSEDIITNDERLKLAGIEAGADKTDAENVKAAGAVMNDELADVAKSGKYSDLSDKPAADAFTSADVRNLQTGKLANGTAPWLDADLQDLADGQLTASKIQYGSYLITSAGRDGEVWTSDGNGAGRWAESEAGGSSLWSENQIGSTTHTYLSNNSGNVGIGTSIPNHKLVVEGNIGVSSGYGYKIGRDTVLTINNKGTFVGDDVATLNTGTYNTFLGKSAGHDNESGSYNTFIGSYAGRNNTRGSRNVFIGYKAGARETGSDKLYISNSDTSNPLIYGEFDDREVTIDGDLHVRNNFSQSDIRWKKNIFPVQDALEKISQLKGVNYEWRIDEYPERGFGEGTQIGLIAQDVEKVVPELVQTDEDGYKTVSYDKMTAVLIEAIKELKAEHQAKIERLEAEIAELMAKVQ